MKRRFGLIGTAAALTTMLTSLPLAASWAEETEAAQPIVLPAVKVSAQKRLEDPIEVPVSLKVFDEQEIEDSNITDIEDLIERTPNFSQLKTGGRGHTTSLNMRGVTSSNTDTGNPTVGVFVDGLRIARGYDFDFYDVERVEILRGPQGTLYGGNSPAGVVNIVSKRPDFVWEGKADLTIGSFETFQERFAIGGPLFDDKVAFRLTGIKLNSEGYIENQNFDKGAETRDDINVRGQLLAKPTPDLDILLNLSGFSYSGRFGSYAPLAQLEEQPHTVFNGELGSADQRSHSQILDVRYRGGAFDFASISGHRYFDSVEKIDVDYTIDNIAFDRSEQSNDQFSQEFRFLSPEDQDDRLKWLVGLYLSHETQDTGNLFTFGSSQFGSDVEVKQRNAAVFGQGTYGATDRLFLTLGARYDYVEKDLRQSDPTQPAVPEGTASDTFKAFLPKAAVEYRWTPDFNTYVTVARGYKPGGFPVFNTGSRSATDPYDSEYTWNYEVGAKASLLADRLLLGASAFYIDIDNQQIRTSTRPGLAPVENIRKSRSVGFELSASGLVTPEWEVFGDFGFTDAKVKDIGDPTIVSTFNGARPAHVPRYEATLGTQYNGRSGLFARASGTLTGPYYLNGQNTTNQESFLLLDAKVGWEFDNFSVYGFVENILDEEYLTRSFSGTLPGQGNVGRQGAPRTFGVVVSAHF